jgi:glycosyltransferase involved in cell wall biosynthesis
MYACHSEVECQHGGADKMISVIIPAHNEANVIARCLSAMLEGAAPGEVQVVVACNGCTDETAKIARGFGDAVQVIETPVASKSEALNMADRVAHGFPRFYVDADVVLPHDAMVKVADVLRQGNVLAAAPAVKFDVTDRPWTVRAFYTIWSQLPYLRAGMIGTGVYAVSEAGRKRFESFPRLTADDAFARLHFSREERQTVDSCFFTVSVPRSLGSVVDIKTRSHFGNYELQQHYPQLWKNEESDHRSAIGRLFVKPWLWPALAIYAYVKVMARVRTRRKYKRGDHRLWERDESSRQASSSAPRVD